MAKKQKEKAGAIFHFNCKVHGRSSGTNAVKLAAYRSGSRLRSDRTGRIYNYSKKKEVSYTAIFAPKDAQPWVFDRELLWNKVDRQEQRSDSQLAREVEIALPLALEQSIQISLITEWINETFVSLGMVADACIHNKKFNPHCHLLLSLRELEPDGFGQKCRSWNDPRLVESWRESWASKVNKYLEQAGLDIRIDHRSFRRRGINKIPTKHFGPAFGLNTEKRRLIIDLNTEINAINQQTEKDQCRSIQEASQPTRVVSKKQRKNRKQRARNIKATPSEQMIDTIQPNDSPSI